MKKILVFLFILLSVYCFAQPKKFIIGAEHVSPIRGINDPSKLPPLSDYIWDKVKEFGLNYAGIKYYQLFPVDSPHVTGVFPLLNIIADLDKAASRGIEVYFTNCFDRNPETGEPYYPKRWIYQLGNNSQGGINDFSIISDKKNNDNTAADMNSSTLKSTESKHFIRLLPGNNSFGIVASNVRKRLQQPEGLKYYLKIKMRLPGAKKFLDSEVLKVTISKGEVSCGRIIKANEFTGNDWKEILVTEFKKTFSGPISYNKLDSSNQVMSFPDVNNYSDTSLIVSLPQSKSIHEIRDEDYDIQIEWLNTGFVVDIDYVAIDDETANWIVSGGLDKRIDDFARNYMDHKAVRNFIVWDEPAVENLFFVNYYKNRIQNILNKAGYTDKTSLCYRTNNPAISTVEFVDETNIDIILADEYPIPYYEYGTTTPFVIPGESNYTKEVQIKFQTRLIPFLEDLISTLTRLKKPYWFTVQTHKWNRPKMNPPEIFSREPSVHEIKAMANLAVCYGAKGIIYYLFSHPGFDDDIRGLFYDDIELPRYYDEYGNRKWEVIKKLNKKLGMLGNDLINLTWRGAKSWSDPGDIYGRWDGVISDIKTNKSSETKYVETGHFLNSESTDYFYIVNRRTMPYEKRTIQVTINKKFSLYDNWVINEVSTSNIWNLRKTGNFETTYEPGEGKLFKLLPVTDDMN